MTHTSSSALVALILLMSACATPVSAPHQPAAPVTQHNGQLELTLASGNYSCENGLYVRVEREMRDQVNYRVEIGWNGHTYRLDRDPSYSGLPRFEDSANGLVWIDLPWKSLLLDARSNTPLANECRSASA